MDVGEVGLDGAWGDEQPCSDVPVGQAFPQQPHSHRARPESVTPSRWLGVSALRDSAARRRSPPTMRNGRMSGELFAMHPIMATRGNKALPLWVGWSTSATRQENLK